MLRSGLALQHGAQRVGPSLWFPRDRSFSAKNQF